MCERLILSPRFAVALNNESDKFHQVPHVTRPSTGWLTAEECAPVSTRTRTHTHNFRSYTLKVALVAKGRWLCVVSHIVRRWSWAQICAASAEPGEVLVVFWGFFSSRLSFEDRLLCKICWCNFQPPTSVVSFLTSLSATSFSSSPSSTPTLFLLCCRPSPGSWLASTRLDLRRPRCHVSCSSADRMIIFEIAEASAPLAAAAHRAQSSVCTHKKKETLQK